MRALLTFSALALLGLFLVPGTAGACDPHSEVCLGQPCNTSAADMKGVTTMDFDEKNLVACLKNESGTGYTWKSMSGKDNSPSGTWCGHAALTCGLLTEPWNPAVDVIPCNGVNLKKNWGGGSYNINTLLQCPTGYSLFSYGNPFTALPACYVDVGGGGENPPVWSYIGSGLEGFYTCVKD